MYPNRADASYSIGDSVWMNITLLDCGVALNGSTVDLEISEDLMPAHEKSTIHIVGNDTCVNIGTLNQPGYLRVKARIKHNGINYSAMSTVAFDENKLLPTVDIPADFDDFWAKNIQQIANVDLSVKMEFLPERSTDKVDVYHISYGNINNSRMYGILTVPKAAGSYPAVLRMPGGGVHPKSGNIKHAEYGVISIMKLCGNGSLPS